MARYEIDTDDNKVVQIKVIGVGGGGGNAVNRMVKCNIQDVEFVAINTDRPALAKSAASHKIEIGEKATKGRGAGAKPEVGTRAAEESREAITDAVTGAEMVFITAGMGGGTGTGAAPVVAKIAKDMGILTVGIVTIPSRFEGPKRLDQAREGVKRLKEHVDSLIIIDNEKIQRIFGSQTLSSAFAKANDVLNIAAKGIAEIITLPGYINVDFADVRTVMTDSGIAIMGAAKASGEDRAKRVIAEALNSPLLNKSDILGASDILLNITSGTDEITMDEMSEITNYVIKEVGDNAAIIWGVGTDEALEDAISVTVIATGFPMEDVENTFTKPLKGVASVNDVSEEAVDAARTKKIKDGVKDYVQVILKESEVVLQPDLSPEKIEELATTPAYTRRHLKIDRP